MYWIAIIFLLIASLASLYYFIKSLLVIGRHNVLYAVLAFFFAPIVHIVFYLTQKESISLQERTSFKRYFMLIGATIVLAFIMMALAPIAINNAAYYY